MNPILVLGIGNILLRDEGVGVHAVRRFQAEGVPEGVDAVDGGTFGADLLDVLADRERVIVIDAVEAEGPPGAILRFAGTDLAARTAVSLSLHDVGLLETLLIARQLKCEPKDVLVFGIIPARLDPGLEMTAEVEAAVGKVLALVRKELAGAG